jgi:hypothetical protein
MPHVPPCPAARPFPPRALSRAAPAHRALYPTPKAPRRPAQWLNLNGNRLTGTIPALPPSLRALVLSNNALEGTLSGLDLSQLELLAAANNSFTGALPSSAVSGAMLHAIQLSGNALSGALPQDWSMPALQMLDLEGNDFTGARARTHAAASGRQALRDRDRVGSGVDRTPDQSGIN